MKLDKKRNICFNDINSSFYSLLIFYLNKKLNKIQYYFLKNNIYKYNITPIGLIDKVSIDLKKEQKNIKICLSNSNLEEARSVKNIMYNLKYNLNYSFKSFVDLFVIDNLGLSSNSKFSDFNRFSVNYIFFSYKTNTEIIVSIPYGNRSSLYTIVDLYNSANWQEREAWDMFGIKFINNIDLRRILTDYGFRGFPLRKDFPTVGFKQVRYDEKADSVAYEDLSLMQEERELILVNPWINLIKEETKDLICSLTIPKIFKNLVYKIKLWKI